MLRSLICILFMGTLAATDIDVVKMQDISGTNGAVNVQMKENLFSFRLIPEKLVGITAQNIVVNMFQKENKVWINRTGSTDNPFVVTFSASDGVRLGEIIRFNIGVTVNGVYQLKWITNLSNTVIDHTDPASFICVPYINGTNWNINLSYFDSSSIEDAWDLNIRRSSDGLQVYNGSLPVTPGVGLRNIQIALTNATEGAYVAVIRPKGLDEYGSLVYGMTMGVQFNIKAPVSSN